MGVLRRKTMNSQPTYFLGISLTRTISITCPLGTRFVYISDSMRRQLSQLRPGQKLEQHKLRRWFIARGAEDCDSARELYLFLKSERRLHNANSHGINSSHWIARLKEFHELADAKGIRL